MIDKDKIMIRLSYLHLGNQSQHPESDDVQQEDAGYPDLEYLDNLARKHSMRR